MIYLSRRAFSDTVIDDSDIAKAAASGVAAPISASGPVLVVPTKGEFSHLANPRRIILAWNQSAEALTAAKRALPLLCAAEIVDVTVVDPRSRGAERSDLGGMLLQPSEWQSSATWHSAPTAVPNGQVSVTLAAKGSA